MSPAKKAKLEAEQARWQARHDEYMKLYVQLDDVWSLVPCSKCHTQNRVKRNEPYYKDCEKCGHNVSTND